jgi:DNA-binding NarL/FixJ family response regulator
MITISIVDDDKDLRQSIASFVDGTPGFRCVSAYSSGEEALRGLPKDQAAVVLMDINMAGMSGIECARKLKAVMAGVQIVMLTVYEDTDLIFSALAAGANGYLLKRSTPTRLIEAIREVHEGGSPMSSSIARKVVASFRHAEQAGDQEALLTPREQSVLDCLIRGLTYKQAADQLGMGLGTFRTHIRRIYEKLQVQSRTEAVVKYLGR